MLYQRQIPIIGNDGQEKLKNAKVVVIGAGGLGSPVLTYLACAGVGNILIVDKDTVDITNLNRQFLYNFDNIGDSKAKVANNKIKKYKVNSKFLQEKLTEKNIEFILKEADVIVDCVDNIATRILLNKYCVLHSVPLVEAGVEGMYGFVTCVKSDTACLECMGITDVKQKNNVPVLGAIAGVIGTLQALECIKVLLDLGDVLYSKMLHFDGVNMSFETIDFKKDENCVLH